MAHPEPHGPLTPAERTMARELLTAQQFVVYKNYRDSQTITWIANREGVTRTRIRHIIDAAQQTLGYERAYAGKQVTAGKYKSVAEERAGKRQEWIAYAQELSEDEWEMLRDSLPRRVRDALDAASKQGAEALLDAEAELFLPHVKSYLRRIGRYLAPTEAEATALDEGGEFYVEKGVEEAGIMEDLGMPTGSRLSDFPADNPNAGLN